MPRRKKGSSTGGGSGKSLMHKGKPQQRNAANARERARMRVLSRAFCRLKTTLPWVPADTKLSKLDTLRLAASYIAHLKGILRDEPLSSEETGGSHPSMSLTWPFGFNRPTTLLGGNGSSVGGGSEAEESIGGSSSCWEPESPTKDCVHLENPGQNELSLGRHLNHPPHPQSHQQHHHHHHLHLQPEEPPLKSDTESVMLQNNPCNNENNNIIPYNFHHGHHDHQQLSSNMSYGYQNDVIMSLS